MPPQVYNPNIAPFINETFWVTSEFWEPRPDGQGGTRYHKGLDIAVPFDLNNPRDVFVYAMANVECVGKGYDASGYGNYIILKDMATLTGFLYGHLRIPANPQVTCDIGDTFQLGQPVGYEGSTGSSTGPHLHLEMQYMNGNNWHNYPNESDYINPATFMGIPNVEGIECFYDGVPIFPKEEKRGFPWVLYARKLRNRFN